MPYTVYKVTNLVTLDFYIGVHKTNDPNDAYLGSGKVIREQVARYGSENFQKVILNSFDKRKEAYRLEAELVNPLLGTPGCLNLHPGGHGGFGYINVKRLNGGKAWTPELQRLGQQAALQRFKQDAEHRTRVVARLRQAASSPENLDRLAAYRAARQGLPPTDEARSNMVAARVRQGATARTPCSGCGNKRRRLVDGLCRGCQVPNKVPRVQNPGHPCPTCARTTYRTPYCTTCVKHYIQEHYLNKSQAQLASHLGISQPAVCRWFRELGLSVNRIDRYKLFRQNAG